MYLHVLFILSFAFVINGCATQKPISRDDYVKAVKTEYIEPVPKVVTVPKVIAAHQLRTFSEEDRKKKPNNKPPYRIIEAANAAATYKPDHYGYFNAIMQYDYAEGALYQIFCAPFKLTDIQLQPGEELLGKPGIGDPVRWKAGSSTSYKNGQKIQHLYIKPTRPDLNTTLILTTNRRTYHIELHSYKKTYMSAVSWIYAQDELDLYSAQAEEIRRENEMIQTSSVDISHANFNYTIEVDEGSPVWKPVRVFDNGKKTYIQFPDALASSEAPALYVLKHGDLQMVNYRVKENYYIVDRLFNQAELRIAQEGGEEIVLIMNDNKGS
jgi:type IV secretion system protein VirB9